MSEIGKPKRCFQFRLRTLLIAIVLLSLPLSWFAVRMESARTQREAVAVIESVGGEVFYEPDGADSIPVWIHSYLGQDFFVKVVQVFVSEREFGDVEATYLKELPDLEELYLDNTQISDAGLEHLKGLTQLKQLDLNRIPITDAGLGYLMINLSVCRSRTGLETSKG